MLYVLTYLIFKNISFCKLKQIKQKFERVRKIFRAHSCVKKAPWNGFNIMLSSLFGDQLNLFNVVDNATADDLLGSWFSKCDFM